jgi:hypothetical protein
MRAPEMNTIVFPRSTLYASLSRSTVFFAYATTSTSLLWEWKSSESGILRTDVVVGSWSCSRARAEPMAVTFMDDHRPGQRTGCTETACRISQQAPRRPIVRRAHAAAS